MNPEDILRLVDSIHRDRGISKDIIFEALEQALASAARKRFGASGEEVEVLIDRITGRIDAREDEEPIDVSGFGRIAARTAYQIITQRIREAERDVIFEDFESKVDTLVTGAVQRFERGAIIVNLGRTEAILPRQEQVFNETYRPGDRIRAYLLAVKKKGQKVNVILSRTHPNLVKDLFTLEVPEISDRVVEIKGLVREPGHRTKIAVASRDLKVDPIGACVGVRGSRIRNIVDELNGEKIDIVRWNESDEIFIRNALSPAEITEVELDRQLLHCRVVVPEDQLSLAIGKKGQNVRLSAKLTGWHIDIWTEEEARRRRQREREELNKLVDQFEWLEQGTIDTLLMTGVRSLQAMAARGVEGLVGQAGLKDEEKIQELVEYAATRAAELEKEIALEDEQAKRAAPPVTAGDEAEETAHAEAAEEAATELAEAEGETEASAAAHEATGEEPVSSDPTVSETADLETVQQGADDAAAQEDSTDTEEQATPAADAVEGEPEQPDTGDTP